MSYHDLRKALTGVLAFVPTMFDEEGELDLDAQAAHIARLVRPRVGALVVTGGAGEFYALERREQEAVVRTSVQAAEGRLPVLAGVGHSTRLAAAQAEDAARAGAAGLLINPFYFVRPEDQGVQEHHRVIGDASGLGLMAVRKVDSDARTLESLAEVEAVVAVKDEHSDLDTFSSSRARFGDRYVWVNGRAENHALEYAQRGAVAMASGVANLDADLAADTWDAAIRGDAVGFAALLESRIKLIATLRAARPGYSVTVVKEAMSLLYGYSPRVRRPLVPLRAEERELLRQHLRDAGFHIASRYEHALGG